MSTISSSPAATAVTASGVSLRPSPAARARKRRTNALLITVVLLGALAGGAYALLKWLGGTSASSDVSLFSVEPRTFQVELKEKGELKTAKSTDIISEVEGRSTIIFLIPEGTVVKEGDLLVELASNQIDDRIKEQELKEADVLTAFEAARTELDIQRDKNASDIRKAELDIELKNLELDKYRLGEWEQKLKDSQIAIDQAKITLERAAESYDADKQLFEKKFITQTQFQESEFNHQKSIWDLEKAEKAREVLLQYTHISDLRKKDSDLIEAKKEAARTVKNAEAEEIKKLRAMEGKEKELGIVREQLARLRAQKEKSRIVAPTQGFVVYYTGGGGGGRWMMNSDSQIKEGAEVHERQILMQLPDTSSMVVNMRVHEAKTNKLRLGQAAMVTVDGIPGAVFEGKVTKIAAVADSASSWMNPDLKEFETEVTLNEADPRLKPGGNAQVRIQVETVEDKLAVPVQAIYAKGNKRYVMRKQGDVVSPLEVVLGPNSSEWIEVTAEGLKPKDSILLAFTEDHLRLIPDAPGGGPGGGPRGMEGGNGGRGGPRQTRKGPPGGAPAAVPPTTATTTTVPATSGTK